MRLIAALPVPLFIIDSCPFGRARTASAEVEPQYDEQIAEVTGRLRQRYPRDPISPADLQDRVRGFHRQFDTARIRTFVAVFGSVSSDARSSSRPWASWAVSLRSRRVRSARARTGASLRRCADRQARAVGERRTAPSAFPSVSSSLGPCRSPDHLRCSGNAGGMLARATRFRALGLSGAGVFTVTLSARPRR